MTGISGDYSSFVDNIVPQTKHLPKLLGPPCLATSPQHLSTNHTDEQDSEAARRSIENRSDQFQLNVYEVGHRGNSDNVTNGRPGISTHVEGAYRDSRWTRLDRQGFRSSQTVTSYADGYNVSPSVYSGFGNRSSLNVSSKGIRNRTITPRSRYSPYPSPRSSHSSAKLTLKSLSSAIDVNRQRQVNDQISSRLSHLNTVFGSDNVLGQSEQPCSHTAIDQSSMNSQDCEVCIQSTSVTTPPSMNVEKNYAILPDKLIHGLRHPNALPEAKMITPPQSPYKDLTGQVKIEPNYFAFGGGSDVYKGEWEDPSSNKGIPVVVKKPRIVGKINEGTLNKYRKHLHREILVWSPLKNRNILPLIGVCNVGPSSVPALVAPYCGGGDVMSYLSEFPGANKTRLIEEVTNGLQYLHSKNVVHGDLKCENVLVRQNGEACICDFGISKIIGRRGFTTHFAGTRDFMAPELFWTPDGADEDFSPSPTKSSDMYAYALVVLQILTGAPPARVLGIPKALNRDRYDPEGRIVNCQLWEVLSRCCLPDPAMRPSIDDMVEFWSNAAGF